MNFQKFILLAQLAALALLASAAVTAAASELVLLEGTDRNGNATSLWLEILERRSALHSDGSASESTATTVKPFNADELAWAALIRERVQAWPAQLPALTQVFPDTAAPPRIRIVLGNRGASDAFTHDPQTIGFDLSALQQAYGDAAGNEDRIDRLFRHEYIHLMQKAWWQDHEFDMSTPQRLAIAETWAEGMGNYFSMSASWRANQGRHSDKARRTLDELEPMFVARLAALACASDEQARKLTADLSMGRFDRKWGALTAALWLEQDMSVNPESLRNFAAAGPDAVWELAARHLPETLQQSLAEARRTAAICESN